MTKTLNRYIALEITVPFFIGLAIFTFIMLTDQLLRLTEMVVSKGVHLTEMINLIIFILPSFFVVTIPMAFLLAILLAFGRLSTDEEITAAKSSGISLAQMMPPVIVLSIITFLVTLFLMIYALPFGNHAFKSTLFSIVMRNADTSITPGKLIDTFTDMVLYISDKDEVSGRYRGVLLAEEKKGQTTLTITAKEGELISTPDNFSVTLRLYDGAIHREGQKDPLNYRIINFKSYDITLNMDVKSGKEGEVPKGDRELSLTELTGKMKELKANGQDYNYLLVELHKKFSIPFACIVFSFIGAPLGIQGKRSGKAHGFIYSLLLITVYYIFLMGGEALGDKGTIPPFLAMWAPNIFFLSIGLYLFKKTNDESEVKIISFFEFLYGHISGLAKNLFRKASGWTRK